HFVAGLLLLLPPVRRGAAVAIPGRLVSALLALRPRLASRGGRGHGSAQDQDPKQLLEEHWRLPRDGGGVCHREPRAGHSERPAFWLAGLGFEPIFIFPTQS